jgi:hypothetical protein
MLPINRLVVKMIDAAVERISTCYPGEPEGALPPAIRNGPNRLSTERFVGLKRAISPKKLQF